MTSCKRFHAPGEFAQAYVIAHEIGHHIQNLLGTSEKVTQMQHQVGEKQANKLSVMLELQADYYAGVWANHAEKKKHILEEGDIESGFNAAYRIGDDTLQKTTQGYACQTRLPMALPHNGSSGSVRAWSSGDINGGNTFEAGQDL